MATRIAARYVPRRMSSGGKIFSEEEKAAENVYIKKMEKEKLEKAARMGPKLGETPAAADAKPSGGDASASANVSTDKYKNYGVAAGILTLAAAVGWYVGSKNKPVEVQD